MEDNLKLMMWNVFSSVAVAPPVLNDARNGYRSCKRLKIKMLFDTGNSEIPTQDQNL